ncbi:dipeptidase [bacterium]|nr:dipeptidase [bacterium]
MVGLSEDRFEYHLSVLEDWLRFPSVSADSAYRNDVVASGQFIADRLAELGGDVTVCPTDGFPVVLARFGHNPSLKTVLIYGHYDVQPPDPLELWTSKPFVPVRRDGQLFARGVSDDKGQIYCHIAAVDELLRHGPLPVNVIFLIEGEEEIGSPNLVPFVERYRAALSADVVVVSDTPMIAMDRPSLCTSLRGLVYFELSVRVLSADLHSGQHGGAVPNAIHTLVQLIAKLKDEQGNVLIPGFYDSVRPISDQLASDVRSLPFDQEHYLSTLGAKKLEGQSPFHPYEQRWYRPTLDVNGIWGGYTGEGSKTVIPAVASCKMSMRLVADQTPAEIIRKVQTYIHQICPHGVTLEVKEPGALPARVSTDHPAVQAAAKGLFDAFGVNPVFQGEGGTIPIVAEFKRILGLDTILMGLNLPDDGIHAPNERMSLANIRRGIIASREFLRHYSDLS